MTLLQQIALKNRARERAGYSRLFVYPDIHQSKQKAEARGSSFPTYSAMPFLLLKNSIRDGIIKSTFIPVEIKNNR